MTTPNIHGAADSFELDRWSVGVRRCGALTLLIVAALIFSPFVACLPAQDYTTSTGSPSFAAGYPAEMGTVDAASGNLHLEIPLGSFPQRKGGQVDLKLAYDTHIWSFVSDGVSGGWLPLTPASQPSFGPSGGWRLTVPGLEEVEGVSSGCAIDYETFAANGTQHWFYVSLGTGTLASGCSLSTASTYAVDSSGLELVATYSKPNVNVQIYGPDGAYLFGAQIGASLPEDANGNYVQSADDVNGSQVLVSNDTLNRQILSAPATNCLFTSSTGFQYNKCYQIATSQGSSQYNLTFADIPLKTNFQQSGISECTTNCVITVISGIGLPDGSSYSFTYDCYSPGTAACNSASGKSGYYGTLTGMTLPTGEIIAYGYTNFTDFNGNVSHWLTSKASPQGTWSYSPSGTYGPGPSNPCLPGFPVSCLQTVVTKPDGSKDIIALIADQVGGNWPQETRSYDTNGTTLLSTVINFWDFSQTCTLNACINPLGLHVGHQDIRITKTQTTLPVPVGSITKQTTFAYDSPQTGNITATKEWEYQSGTSSTATFPAVPDRATYTVYAVIGASQNIRIGRGQSAKIEAKQTVKVAAIPNTAPAGWTNNIIDHPFTEFVCNNVGSDPTNCPGGGTLVAGRVWNYDNYGQGNVLALSGPTGIANHDDTNFGSSFLLRGNPTTIGTFVLAQREMERGVLALV
jgi:hypothetical protein